MLNRQETGMNTFPCSCFELKGAQRAEIYIGSSWKNEKQVFILSMHGKCESFCLYGSCRIYKMTSRHPIQTVILSAVLPLMHKLKCCHIPLVRKQTKKQKKKQKYQALHELLSTWTPVMAVTVNHLRVYNSHIWIVPSTEA